MRKITAILLLSALLLLCGCSGSRENHVAKDETQPPMYSTPSAAPLITGSSLPTPEPTKVALKEVGELDAPRLVAYKSARRLELYDGDTLVNTYPIGLGFTPEGAKECEGDGKTPEGDYYICTRNANSRFYLSIGISYPNQVDAERGLSDGLITQAEYRQITEAISSGEQPPWNTALGGEIMIHGMGVSRDWTAGCIAVENDVMDILWRVCALGTTLKILP